MFRPGNRLTLLENGAGYFPALLAALDAAQHEIHLETYIFEPDATGRAVLDALLRAAHRAVRVRLLLDGFGCRNFPKDTVAQLRRAGVRVLFFRPELALLRLHRRRLRRMHRKIVLIDQRIAFVGGINIIDDRNGPALAGQPPDHRYDYAVRVEGPLVADMWQAVRRLWWLVRWSQLGRRAGRRLGYRIGGGRRQTSAAVKPAVGNQPAAFLVRDNLRNRHAIEQAYLTAIRNAREEIILANAYFLPGRRFRHALIQAARRGVRVVLLMQGHTDHRFYLLAAKALYGHLLENGVEIHEYQASYLHAKVATIDEDWATVGSSNIDPFSLVLAREGNLVARDCRFTDELRHSLHRAIREHSKAIHPRAWREQPLYRRAASWVVYGLVRLAAGLVGYAGLN